METAVNVSVSIQEQDFASEIREELRSERDSDECWQSSGAQNNSESNLELSSLAFAGKSVEPLKIILMVAEMVTLPKREQGQSDEKKAYCIKSSDQTENKAKVVILIADNAVTELFKIAVEETLKVRTDRAVIKKNQVKKCLELFAKIAVKKDDHEKFCKQFDKCTKLGIHEGCRKRTEIADLLRSNTPKSGDEQVCLKEYVDRMKEGHDEEKEPIPSMSQERIQERIVEETIDVPVQVIEETVETVKHIPQERLQIYTVEHMIDVPQIREGTGEVTQLTPQERTSDHVVEQISRHSQPADSETNC